MSNTEGIKSGNRANAPVVDLTPDQIAAACHVPLDAARANWPFILAALRDLGIGSTLVQVGAAATVAVETAWTFRPIVEKLANPAKQPDLAKIQAKYYPFHGRGLGQITWEENYRDGGKAIGVDLLNHPELACDPWNSARLVAWEFKRKGIDKACLVEDWRTVRRKYNGGYNGMDRFQACVNALLEVVE